MKKNLHGTACYSTWNQTHKWITCANGHSENKGGMRMVTETYKLKYDMHEHSRLENSLCCLFLILLILKFNI